MSHNKKKERIIEVKSTSGLDTNLAFVLNKDYPLSYKYGQIKSSEEFPKKPSTKTKQRRIKKFHERSSGT